MKIGICGFGLIGKQRLAAIHSYNPAIEVVVLEPFLKEVPDIKNVVFVENEDNFWSQQLDAVIVATPHQYALEYVTHSLERGLKTLVEKPLGRTYQEAKLLSSLDKNNLLSVGFNYRFMPGVIQFIEELKNGSIGNLISIKFVLGHGGSPEDKDSWKLDPEIAGGGALLDPGIHLIDLLINELNFMGAAVPLAVTDWSGFWDTGIEEQVEILGRIGKSSFSITSSVVLWRTTFNIQAVGENGYLEVNGRGRSDGPQTFTFGPRWGWLEAASQFESERTKVLMVKDSSLEAETKAWIQGQSSVCDSSQALQSMKFYDSLKQLLTKEENDR